MEKCQTNGDNNLHQPLRADNFSRGHLRSCLASKSSHVIDTSDGLNILINQPSYLRISNICSTSGCWIYKKQPGVAYWSTDFQLHTRLNHKWSTSSIKCRICPQYCWSPPKSSLAKALPAYTHPSTCTSRWNETFTWDKFQLDTFCPIIWDFSYKKGFLYSEVVFNDVSSDWGGELVDHNH